MKIKLFAVICATIFVTDASAEMNQNKKKITYKLMYVT